jgi:GTPase SAR1 family protein
MEEIIKTIIDEYKKKGYINFYIIGQEGVGKSILISQILERVCNELDIKINISMYDFNNDIATVKGINLIGTFYDSDRYKFKVKVMLKRNSKGLICRGFYLFDNKTRGRFSNYQPFKELFNKERMKSIQSNHFQLFQNE